MLPDDHAPSREMTPHALREIAAWMDVHDKIARAYIDLALSVGLGQHSELLAARDVVNGTGVQDDLRRWADELPKPCRCYTIHEEWNSFCPLNGAVEEWA